MNIDKLTNIIYESMVEAFLKGDYDKNAPENQTNATSEKPFGNILFGGYDNAFSWKLNHHKKLEQDTDPEERLSYVIKSWINGEFMAKDKLNTIDWFKYIKKHEDHFPHYLKPNSNDLYRIEFKDQKWLDYFSAKHPNIDLDKWYDTIYRAKWEAQSWTTIKDKNLIKRNIINYIEYGSIKRQHKSGCAIIYHAIVPEEQLLFNEEFTGTIMGTNQGEIVRISNAPLKCRVMIYDRYQKEKEHSNNNKWEKYGL